MADSQFIALSRADAGTPTSGVIRVRTRLTADFTVLANALAQRRGSAVTVGVAAYILSLPDGAPVTVAALCAHFTEGEILISRALRELEQAGYLERRRERGPRGLIRTRTYVYDVPRHEPPVPPPPTPPRQPRPPRPTGSRAPAPIAAPVSLRAPGHAPAPVPAPPPEPRSTSASAFAATPTPPFPEADSQAVVILASLRIADPRLILSAREVAQLAPAVTRWLAAGVGAAQLTEALTSGLPDRFLARPSRILAFRLRELPLPVPEHPVPARDKPVVLPWQTCDGCERAFRAPEPGHCRDCRSASPEDDGEPAAAYDVSDLCGRDLRAAC